MLAGAERIEMRTLLAASEGSHCRPTAIREREAVAFHIFIGTRGIGIVDYARRMSS